MLPLIAEPGFGTGTTAEVNPILHTFHYLGPVGGAIKAILVNRSVLGEIDQCQVWKLPIARHLPSDGTWLELARWCIVTDEKNAGSWFMGRARRWMRRNMPEVSTLVSYSELGRHSGGLYRASGWELKPTHHSERFHKDGIGYASGHGNWRGGARQAPKERWVIELHAINPQTRR